MTTTIKTTSRGESSSSTTFSSSSATSPNSITSTSNLTPIKYFLTSFLSGFLDSLKGIVYLIQLDQRQQRAHADRNKFSSNFAPDNQSSSSHHSTARKHLIKNGSGRSKEEPRLLFRVFQCCCLNGLIFGCSIVVFHNLVLPGVQLLLTRIFTRGDGDTDISSSASKLIFYMNLFLYYIFGALWIVPLYLLSLVVNGLWFQDISTLSFRYSIGRPRPPASLSLFIADNLFSTLVQMLFMLQGLIASALIPLPTLPYILTISHFSLLYSFYSFEYKWSHVGWPLDRKLSYLESHWPYFLGFGFSLALISSVDVGWALRGCIFGALFPIWVVGANGAEVDERIGGACGRLRAFQGVVIGSGWVLKRGVGGRGSGPMKTKTNLR